MTNNSALQPVDVSSIKVPDDLLNKWQKLLNTLAACVGVPIALVNEIKQETITILAASATEKNPFAAGMKADVKTEYCNVVRLTGREFMISDATRDPKWKNCNDAQKGLISYLGFPLRWPDENFFGTICLFDYKPNDFGGHRELIGQFSDQVNAHLALLYRNLQLANYIDALEATKKELLKKEELYHTIFESANDAIFFHVPGDKFLEVNQAACDLLGYPKKEFLELTARDIIPPERLSGLEYRLTKAAQGNVTMMESQLMDKQENVIPVEISSRVIDYQSQNVSLSVVRNISERKLAEKAIREARDIAQSANDEKNRFVANMSHELRTPLNVILGYAQFLLRKRDLAPQQVTALQSINKSGDLLLQMINDILDIAKIDAGRLEFQSEDFDFIGMLHAVADVGKMRAAKKQLNFNFAISSVVPRWVKSDERKIRQVLINLIENAIKFTEDGCVGLRVGGVNDSTNSYFLEVRDTGRGIPSDLHEKIFDPFFRVESSEKHIEGSGLGLAISKKLANRVGGNLFVKESSIKGSVFRFELTLPKASNVGNDEHENAPFPIGYTGTSKKILIADDATVNREILVEILNPLGFITDEAENGSACIEKSVEFQPDLIIMDLKMPILDGWQATARIKKESPAPPKIIAFSASAFSADMKAAEDAGCDLFLPKPLDMNLLLDGIASLLEIEWTFRPTDVDPVASDQKVNTNIEILRSLKEPARSGDLSTLKAIMSSNDFKSGLNSQTRNQLEKMVERYDFTGLINQISEIIGPDEE